MSSLVTLDRIPALGFNSEYRLRAAVAQQPNEKACFIKTKTVLENPVGPNISKVAGCLPVVCLFVGAGRLYRVYVNVYGEEQIQKWEEKEKTVENATSWYQENKRNAAISWLEDRNWTLIKMSALGVAEICHLTVILAAAHVVKTIFDHIVAACNQPATDSREYQHFQSLIEKASF